MSNNGGFINKKIEDVEERKRHSGSVKHFLAPICPECGWRSSESHRTKQHQKFRCNSKHCGMKTLPIYVEKEMWDSVVDEVVNNEMSIAEGANCLWAEDNERANCFWAEDKTKEFEEAEPPDEISEDKRVEETKKIEYEEDE